MWRAEIGSAVVGACEREYFCLCGRCGCGEGWKSEWMGWMEGMDGGDEAGSGCEEKNEQEKEM